MMKKNLALYVHIPFCIKKCYYCDFLSGPSGHREKEKYIDALLAEIDCYSSFRMDEQYKVTSIFIGGGTPSSIDAKQIHRILERIYTTFHVDPADPELEITIEINPGTVTEEKLVSYKKAGINRISFGLQSADDTELKVLGRIHTYQEFVHNYELARRIGFQNINVDLMTALPGQTMDSFRNTLQKVLERKPDHISAYSLIIEEGTPFYEMYHEDGICQGDDICRGMLSDSKIDENHRNLDRRELIRRHSMQEAFKVNKGLALPGEDVDRTMYEMTKEIFHSHGYERYEISNYAKAGYECRHNLAYWIRQDYIGFGCGAASLFQETRFTNVDELQEYIQTMDVISADQYKKSTSQLAENESSVAKTSRLAEKQNFLKTLAPLRKETEKLSINAQMEEFMFLGLRCMKGVSAIKFEKCFGTSMDSVYGSVLRLQIEEGLIAKEGEWYRLTDRGIDISNYVLSEFLFDE